jgi:hypothetical protein
LAFRQSAIGSPPSVSITSHSSGPSQSAARPPPFPVPFVPAKSPDLPKAEPIGCSGSFTPSARDRAASDSAGARREMRLAGPAASIVTREVFFLRPASVRVRRKPCAPPSPSWGRSIREAERGAFEAFSLFAMA